MSYTLGPEAIDRDLVLAFFWRFSVLECALKREGFLSCDRYGNAKPNWRDFENKIAGQLVQAAPEAVARLCNEPPRRQVVIENEMRWRSIERPDDWSDERYILELVRAVRNNLFHGGKYPGVNIEEVARDRELLQAALDVVEACFRLHPGVRRWVPAA